LNEKGLKIQYGGSEVKQKGGIPLKEFKTIGKLGSGAYGSVE